MHEVINNRTNRHLIGLLCVAASLFLFAKFANEIKGGEILGNEPKNTMTFTGKGEVSVAPDIATITFTVREEARTVKEAKEKMAATENEAIKFLKDSGIDEKDYKAVSFNSYPKYEYQYDTDITCGALTCPPRPTKQVISGFEVSETLEVKVRDIDKANDIVDGLGNLKVSEIGGPNFAIDDEEAVRAEARRMAIAEAKEKAEALARDLGIRLGDIVGFSEDGFYYPMYRTTDAKFELMAGQAAPASPELPAGENTITSNVTITYEIK